MRIGFTVALTIVWTMLTGCMSGTESIAADVSPEGWREPVELQYSNADTLTLKKIRLTLRHSATREMSGGRFLLETASPSGAVTRDTLWVRVLLKAQGNKLEEAWAPPMEVRFPEAGGYVFTVTPMAEMRGVWSVGIEFTKTR